MRARTVTNAVLRAGLLAAPLIAAVTPAAAQTAAAQTAAAQTAAVQSGMPDAAFRGAERIALLCSVDAGHEPGHEEIARGLCERIVRIAAPGSPVPIEIVDYGSDALRAPGSVALLVHAAIVPASSAVPGADGKILSFTMRTLPQGPSASTPAWFGAPPRLLAFSRDGDPTYDDALRASLSQVLPWLRPADARPSERLTKGLME